LKIAFVNTYTTEVAKRLDKEKWNMPKRWGDQVYKTIDLLVAKEVDSVNKVIVFVKAQFHTFDQRLCAKLFRMKYPPIGVFKTGPSFTRYFRYVNSMMKDASTKKKSLDIPAIVVGEYGRSQCSKSGRLNLDKLHLCIQNRSVSPYTVAFLIFKFQLAKEVCRELANLVRVCQEEDLYESYKIIETLIDKGDLDAK